MNNDYLEVYEDTAGAWRWRLKAGNHRVIATSGESFASAANAKRAGTRVTGLDPKE